jgi:hypothetical protein
MPLTNLPGIKGGGFVADEQIKYARRVGSVLTALARYMDGDPEAIRAVIVAGDHGCVVVYVDDNAEYRANFCRLLAVYSELKTATKTDVVRWLKVYAPYCFNPPGLLGQPKE